MRFDPNCTSQGKSFRVVRDFNCSNGSRYTKGTILTFVRVDWRGPHLGVYDFQFNDCLIQWESDDLLEEYFEAV
jgi:hypothetical protein